MGPTSTGTAEAGAGGEVALTVSSSAVAVDLATPPALHRADSTLRNGLPNSVSGLLVSFQELTYSVKAKSGPLTLLDNLSGFFQPKQLTALMGPSGSGKTTLLDVLAGRKTTGTTTGRVLYDCEPPTKAFLRRHTGYVEQFDTLVENMTVHEMLMYTAHMKLPHTTAKSKKAAEVDKLLDRLGLMAAKDTLIGGQNVKGISGGQAKRVNIGVSLITDPYVLYLDEPTSGLDSFTADEVMRLVKSFARNGITVCATIHSPSPKTFELFDQLVLLVQGKMVYFGQNLDPATQYFYDQRLSSEPFDPSTDFPADWLVMLATSANREGEDRIAQMSAAYEASLGKLNTKNLKDAVQAVTSEGGGFVQQATTLDYRAEAGTATPVWWALRIFLFYRSLKNFKDPLFLSARIVDKAIVASIIVSLFHSQARYAREDDDLRAGQQAAACLFMWTAAPMFSAAAYLPTFMLERALFRRERSDGIFNIFTYYAAKWVEECIIAVPVSIVLCGIVYAAVGFSGNFWFFWITWLVTLLTSIGISFCFAMLAPTIDFANGSVPSYGGTLLYFMGFLISLDAIPVWWTWYSYIDFLRHGYVAIMVNEFQDYAINSLPAEGGFTGLLDIYGMADMSAPASLGFLLIFTVVFAGGALFLLKFLKYGSR